MKGFDRRNARRRRRSDADAKIHSVASQDRVLPQATKAQLSRKPSRIFAKRSRVWCRCAACPAFGITAKWRSSVPSSAKCCAMAGNALSWNLERHKSQVRAFSACPDVPEACGLEVERDAVWRRGSQRSPSAEPSVENFRDGQIRL